MSGSLQGDQEEKATAGRQWGWGQREEGDKEVPIPILSKHGGRPRGQ